MVVRVAALPMEEQQPTVVLHHMEGRHRMEVAQHMAAMTATEPRMVASTLAVVRLVGEVPHLGTQRQSQICRHLRLELTMRLHQVHTQRQHLVVMVRTLHLHLAVPWMLLRPAITPRLLQETATALRQRLHQPRVPGIFQHQHRAARILATIESVEFV